MDSISIINRACPDVGAPTLLMINISTTKFILDTDQYCNTGKPFPYNFTYVHFNFQSPNIETYFSHCEKCVKLLNPATDAVCIFKIPYS